MKNRSTPAHSRVLALFAATLVAGSCGDDPAGVVFEVIEETTFAPSLNIDLSQMTMLGNGMYVLDITPGTGTQVVFGSDVTVAYTGFLSNGTQFDSGQFTFLMGNNEVIRGFEDGIVGMLVGGQRRMIIPPNLGYGEGGSGAIPPGAILIFDVEIIDVQ